MPNCRRQGAWPGAEPRPCDAAGVSAAPPKKGKVRLPPGAAHADGRGPGAAIAKAWSLMPGRRALPAGRPCRKPRSCPAIPRHRAGGAWNAAARHLGARHRAGISASFRHGSSSCRPACPRSRARVRLWPGRPPLPGRRPQPACKDCQSGPAWQQQADVFAAIVSHQAPPLSADGSGVDAMFCREAACRSRLSGRGKSGRDKAQDAGHGTEISRAGQSVAGIRGGSGPPGRNRGRINGWGEACDSRGKAGTKPVHFLPQGIDFAKMVRVEGLEPPRLAAPEPKSGASANFATPATARSLAKPQPTCER